MRALYYLCNFFYKPKTILKTEVYLEKRYGFGLQGTPRVMGETSN